MGMRDTMNSAMGAWFKHKGRSERQWPLDTSSEGKYPAQFRAHSKQLPGRNTRQVVVVLAIQFHLNSFRHVLQNSSRTLSGRYKTGIPTRSQWPLVLANGKNKGLVRIAILHESLTYIIHSAQFLDNSSFLSTVPCSML